MLYLMLIFVITLCTVLVIYAKRCRTAIIPIYTSGGQTQMNFSEGNAAEMQSEISLRMDDLSLKLNQINYSIEHLNQDIT